MFIDDLLKGRVHYGVMTPSSSAEFCAQHFQDRSPSKGSQKKDMARHSARPYKVTRLNHGAQERYQKLLGKTS